MTPSRRSKPPPAAGTIRKSTPSLRSRCVRPAGRRMRCPGSSARSSVSRPMPRRSTNSARLLTSMERYDEAIEALTPRPRSRADDAGYIDPARLCFSAAQEHCAEAKIAFARALAIAPSSPDALFGMAQGASGARRKRGRRAEYFRALPARSRPDDAGRLAQSRTLSARSSVNARPATTASARPRAATPKRLRQSAHSLAESGRGRFWLKPSARGAVTCKGPEPERNPAQRLGARNCRR